MSDFVGTYPSNARLRLRNSMIVCAFNPLYYMRGD